MKTVVPYRLTTWMFLSLLIQPLAFSDWSNTYLENANPLRKADYEIDAAGTLYRAFMDYATGSLVMETLGPDGVWDGEIVDDEGITGYSPNLFFDPLDRPVIIYYDLTNNASYMARKLDTGWSLETLLRYPELSSYQGSKIFFDETHMHGFTIRSSADSQKMLIHFKVPLYGEGPPSFETMPMPDPQNASHIGFYRVRQDENDPEHFVFVVSYLNISGGPPPIGSPDPGPTIFQGIAIGEIRNGTFEMGPIIPREDRFPWFFLIDNTFTILRLTSYADADTPPVSTVQLLQESGDHFEIQDLTPRPIPYNELNALEYAWLDDDMRLHWVGRGSRHPETPIGKQRHYIYDRSTNRLAEEGESDSVPYSEFLGQTDRKHYLLTDSWRGYTLYEYDTTSRSMAVLKEKSAPFLNVSPRIAKDASGQIHICRVVGQSVLYQNSSGWSDEAEILAEEPLTPIIQDFKVINDTLHLVYTIQESGDSDYPKPVPQGICYIAHLTRPVNSSEWRLEKGALRHPENGYTATKAFVNLDLLDPANPRIVGLARFYDMVNKPPVTPAELAVGYQIVRCDMSLEEMEILTEIDEQKPHTFINQLIPWLDEEGMHNYLFPASSGIESVRETDNTWIREVIIPTTGPASYLDGVVDGSGNLHLTFDSSGLQYAVVPPGGDAILTDLSSFTQGRLAATNSTEPLQLVDLDTLGNPVIMYNDSVRWPISYTTYALRFAELVNGEWRDSTVLPGSKGRLADMVELDGVYHIAYSDYEEGATGYVFGSPARIERQFSDAAQHYGQETYKSQWFGIMQDTAFPFIEHEDHGWLYMDASADQQLFWSYGLNAWLFTEKAVYPYIYDYGSKQWMYYYQSLKNETWYYMIRDKVFIH